MRSRKSWATRPAIQELDTLMPSIPLYQVDAFTDRPFGGNPAAVCPLESWLPDEVMQAIAMENNLSETAFFVAEDDGFRLRWFTPTEEVPLCGHATLATAFVMFECQSYGRDIIKFITRQSGTLTVKREGGMIAMNFPALPAIEVGVPAGLADAMGGIEPVALLRAVKNMAVLKDEDAVRAVVPNLDFIEAMEGDGLIVTAPGDNADCASRYFAPHVGIDEDPVTGSAHCTVIPYWAEKLGKTDIHAQQVSRRMGDLFCEMNGDRVSIAGHARLVIEGTFAL